MVENSLNSERSRGKWDHGNLKGSHDAISSFLSLWSVTSCLCIDKIPKVAKTKDFFGHIF